MKGPFPVWDHCPKCNSEMTEKKFVNSEVPLLSWHCKACQYDWESRTWDQPPIAGEHVHWHPDFRKTCAECLLEDVSLKKKNNKDKSQNSDEDLPV